MEALNQDKVEYIIAIAREIGEESSSIIDDELGENNEPYQYSELSIASIAETSKHEDHASDSAYQELKSLIDSMNEEERSELVALTWLGRNTYIKSEWETAVEDARQASNKHTAEYLINMPLLPDYLTEGLSIMTED